ncbi:hypothetical protein [Cerasicoccus maritimus]|uniref:hypothetical protein n=1 Tax=Cerasicoccus maritimus TaxID=490089 RepID=UPI002852777B|nr:hypothetical protein [Cerasicoccus maritimus]
MKKVILSMLALGFAAYAFAETGSIHAPATGDDAALDYDPNAQLQEFFNALPNDLQSRIGDYREKATIVAQEVAEYNERPRNGLPPSSFKSAQRKRMKIEAQMASLRLEQKAIAKEYYDLLASGWTPPNNSNIIRLLVAQTNDQPAAT